MTSVAPTPSRRSAGLRAGFLIAGLLLAIALSARLTGNPGVREVAVRVTMVLVAGYLVLLGNGIPKHEPASGSPPEAGRRWQPVYRLAGWVWVLAGLGLGLAWTLWPGRAAEVATFVLLPSAIMVVGLRVTAGRAGGAA